MAPVIVIGFMGAGKSTLGRRLAEHRGVPHLDTDALLEERLGKPIAAVFADEGEARFREAEQQLVLEQLASSGDSVVSLGGGAVTSSAIAEALAEHTVVYLEAPADELWGRVDGSDRPLAQDRAAFEALHAERAPLYEAVASAVVPSVDPDVLVRADGALKALESAPQGVRMVWAEAASGSYPAFIGPGALSVQLTEPAGRRYVVTDSAVAEHHLTLVHEPAGAIEMPNGEEHKTLETTERVWQALIAQQATRADHVLALGGGVVGDLAGFAAACFQRGIPVVQAPTTVVSQVDSAYGGKTGVDLPQAKNYVGAYHQPAAVLADTTTLATLPPEEHAAGYAEVVKTALIAGGSLWDRIASGGPVDDEVIFGCARTKLQVVASDERDGGRRQVLNLGHTIGHALETVSGYGTLRHGEAVALGTLAALRLSGLDELRTEVAGLFTAAGLPTQVPPGLVTVEAVAEAIGRDKKRVGSAATPFVLVFSPGDVRHGCEVDAADVEAAVAELLV